MTQRFLKALRDEAADPFRAGGRFAYYYARGKLSSDSIFREILRLGILPAQGRYLDLGCGQGSLFAWLLAARGLYEQGRWPRDWPPPPRPARLRGIELMPRDVRRAVSAFGPGHPVVSIEQGDMRGADFGRPDVITILDALHYLNFALQEDVLRRVHTALAPGGLFLTRIGDADAGLPFQICKWVDRSVIFIRGHSLPRLYCRTLSDWSALLRQLGFQVEHMPMNEGKPFANVMLVCRPH